MDDVEQANSHRTLGGFFWSSGSTTVQALLQLLVLVALARLLTPLDFGVMAAALVVIGFSAIFSQCGIGPAVVQRLELHAAHLRAGFTISLLLGGLLAALVWLLAPVCAEFFRMEQLSPVLKLIALVFPLQALSVVAEALLQREMRFRLLAVIEISAVAVGYGGMGITLAVLGLGVWALVGAHLAQAVLKTFLLLIARPHPMRPGLELRTFAELMYFGGGFTAARVGNYMAGQCDNLVVGRWLGVEALGIYGRAYQLMVGPAMLLGEAIDRVLFPAMSKVQHQPEQLAMAYRRCVAFIALVVLPASAMVVLLAPELIQVLLGSEWAQVAPPLQILAVGMLFRTSYKMSDSVVRATGAVYRRAWRQVIYALSVLVGALAGQRWGVSGVAWGVLGSLIINFLLMAQLSLSLTSMTWQSFLTAHFPGIALAALVSAETFAIRESLRVWNQPAIVVLLVTAACIPFSLLVVRRLPHFFLGQDGRWMVQMLASYLAGKRRSSFAQERAR